MVGEDALLRAAEGDFALTLLGYLTIAFVLGGGSLLGLFIWAIKKLLEQNASFNQEHLTQFKALIEAVEKYNKDTLDAMRCYKEDTLKVLHDHDEQAKSIKSTQEKVEAELRSRPCMNGIR